MCSRIDRKISHLVLSIWQDGDRNERTTFAGINSKYRTDMYVDFTPLFNRMVVMSVGIVTQ